MIEFKKHDKVMVVKKPSLAWISKFKLSDHCLGKIYSIADIYPQGIDLREGYRTAYALSNFKYVVPAECLAYPYSNDE